MRQIQATRMCSQRQHMCTPRREEPKKGSGERDTHSLINQNEVSNVKYFLIIINLFIHKIREG